MARPFLRYPVNHHLSQILERAVAIAAVRSHVIAGEFGLFNGDEPERPGQWPRIGGRFGDSWAARITAYPVNGAEVQASHARVHSPEHRAGAGTDQDKWSVSARWSGGLGGHPVYGLLEWARTSEADGFFVFHSCSPRVHGARAAIVSSIGSSGPSGPKRSESAISGRAGPTSRTRFSAPPAGRCMPPGYEVEGSARSTRAPSAGGGLRTVGMREGRRRAIRRRGALRAGSLLVGKPRRAARGRSADAPMGRYGSAEETRNHLTTTAGMSVKRSERVRSRAGVAACWPRRRRLERRGPEPRPPNELPDPGGGNNVPDRYSSDLWVPR